jgi:hypothetical protein
MMLPDKHVNFTDFFVFISMDIKKAIPNGAVELIIITLLISTENIKQIIKLTSNLFNESLLICPFLALSFL